MEEKDEACKGNKDEIKGEKNGMERETEVNRRKVKRDGRQL